MQIKLVPIILYICALHDSGIRAAALIHSSLACLTENSNLVKRIPDGHQRL